MRLEKREILSQIKALREARPRHFWSGIGVATASFTAMVAAFAVAPHGAALRVDQANIVEQIALPVAASTATDGPFVSQTRIQRGDTVGRLFSRLGVDDAPAMEQLRRDPDAGLLFRQLRPGKTVTARTGADGELLSLYFPLNGGDQALRVQRRGADFAFDTEAIAHEPNIVARSGEIRSSLFEATDAADIPDAIAAQLAEIFAGDIDFHRDLRRGDRFAVVYEVLHAQGRVERAGRVLAAEFTNQGTTHRAFLYSAAAGRSGYYDANGKSLRKAFLRSPLEFSRVSSGFAMRVHPILGTLRAHKGVDYAAPIGTRVRAAGDGIVESFGKRNGYGNTIVLQHRGSISTYYAHLSGFAPSLRRGARVSQGDVIGYVGMSGLATGPHLHYEFRVNDVHKNPLTVAMPEAPPLGAALRSAFIEGIQPLAMQLSVVQTGPLARVE